jgi:hypothetical protein
VILFAGIYWYVKGRHEYLIGSNSILDDNLIMHGEAVITGREAAAAFRQPKTDSEKQAGV